MFASPIQVVRHIWTGREGYRTDTCLLYTSIEDITTGKTYQGSKLPEHVLSIVEDGGLKNHLKKTLKKA